MATLTSISTSNYYYYVVDTGSTNDVFLPLAMTTKALVEMLESGLSVSYAKMFGRVVQTYPSKPKSNFEINRNS